MEVQPALSFRSSSSRKWSVSWVQSRFGDSCLQLDHVCCRPTVVTQTETETIKMFQSNCGASWHFRLILLLTYLLTYLHMINVVRSQRWRARRS